MSLLELQRQFRAYLVDAPSDIAGSAGGDGDAGLAIYHNAYRANLVACLSDTYERLWAWLGDEAFEAAARRHIAEHPPRSWTLADYGDDFATTLHMLYPDDPEVAELGRLDWALRRAFDGADADAITAADLAEVDWDNAVLHFVPTLSVFPVTTNCGAIWRAISAEETPPAAERLPAPAFIRVWRSGLSPQFCTIEALEQRTLALASNGESFASLCVQLEAEFGAEKASATAGELLSRWLLDGVLQTVTF